tara:strand:- start:1118 stop:1963 length:846 start_codon:yes stop_codon:yes gene_type:complete
MAISQTQTLPPQFVSDLGKDYATQMLALTSKPLDTTKFQPMLAGQDQAQKDAYTMATTTGQGIGAYQPYLTQAGQFQQQAAGLTGPGAYQQFMSPYQQQVIDATLKEYDTQRAKDLRGMGLMAANSGNVGGGREGVMRSEYQSQSNLDRAALQARMLQQGYQDAQRGAQTAFGQAQQLGADQQRLAQLVPQLRGRDIATLGQAGAIQQAQTQAELDQQREANRLAAYEPYERLGFMGTGLGSLFGSAMGQYQSSVTPNQSPLQQALGIAATGIGAYKAFDT